MKNAKILKRMLLISAPAMLLVAPSLAGATDITIPNVKVYGFVNAQIESVQALGGATPYSRKGRISDGNSRIGFTGNIDINDSIKGIWQLEGSLNSFEQGGVNDQGTSSTIVSRNSFIGIEDKTFGRFIVGNNDSAYRSLIGSAGELGGNIGLTVQGLDLWNNTSAQMSGNATSIFGRGEARYKNSAHYFSPTWGGLQIAASYGFDEAQVTRMNHERYSLAFKYTLGQFEIGGGLDHQTNTGVDIAALEKGYGFATSTQSGLKTEFYKVIASYKLPTNTYVGIGYEHGDYGYSQFIPASGSNIYSTNKIGKMAQASTMVSVAQNFDAKTAVMVSAGQLGNLSNSVVGAGSEYKATQYTVGATYKLSPKFMGYVYYTEIKNGARQNVNLGQAPIYSNEADTGGAFLAPGDNPHAVGLGMISWF